MKSFKQILIESAVDYKSAIDKIAAKSAKRMLGDYYDGAMLPRGLDLYDTAEALALIFDKNSKTIQNDLEKAEKIQYKKLKDKNWEDKEARWAKEDAAKAKKSVKEGLQRDVGKTVRFQNGEVVLLNRQQEKELIEYTGESATNSTVLYRKSGSLIDIIVVGAGNLNNRRARWKLDTATGIATLMEVAR